ncbi:MAG TPA: hypothetical protein VF288_03340 [Mycobacteriales bacterium]
MSAAVLAVLVVLWLVVLVPMFLHRHDRNIEGAAADRFAGAMRVLSRRRGRRGGLVDRRYLLGSSAPSAERAEVISRALQASAATEPVESQPRPPSASRRAARIAARRRGLAVMVGVILVSLLVAVLLGGFWWAVQGLADVLAAAGLAQLRASALADRFVAPPVRSSSRPAAALTTEPVSPRRPLPVERHRPAHMVPEMPAAQGLAYASGHDVAPPVVRGAGKQIVFDAVTETPLVDAPQVRKVPPKPTHRPPVHVGVPDDFYERPVSPPAPERVRQPHVPLLDEVDTDPDTMTAGLDLLDGILDRASGE